MSDSEKTAELLLRWEELRQQGDDPSVEELCADCPELVDELERHIRAVRKMESMLNVGSSSSEVLDSGVPTTSPDRIEEVIPPPSIPDYEVLDTLGRGGMGVVYRARQSELGRIVAVKMLDAGLVGTRQLERFFDEARAVARLKHPNIVQIFDFGQGKVSPFFSMELVDGGNLKDRLADGPLDVDDGVRLTETIARAVHVVHCEGYVHRDLKPANILLTDDGQPKITDFGLAKRLDDDSGHTRTGEILGTVGYMAPEQLDHSLAEIDPRTDVYALGTLLFEMLTGAAPFASNPALALKQVLHDDAPLPTRIQKTVPRDVEAICLKCLEKNVANRYQSAEALADDLKRYLEHKPVVARQIGTARRVTKWLKRRPQVSASLVILTLALAAWPITTEVRERQERAQLHARAVEVAPLAHEILQRNCYECHGADPDVTEKDLDVLDHRLLIDSDRRLVVPGKPGDSRLVQRIADGSMPPEDMETLLPRLTEEELVILNDWVSGGAPAFPAEDPQNPTPPVVAYSAVADEAKEIFERRCYECHKYDVAEGGIKILHHRLLLHVRKVVVPGKPDESELFQLVVSQDEDMVMPPLPRKPLTPAEIDVIRRWIVAGAPPFPKTDN